MLDNWRKENFIPLFKKGKEEGLGNSPVSMTSIPGKLMEQIILEVITTHVKEKKVVGSCQHGFTERKFCLTGYGMAVWVDEGVDVIYLDFSKAFFPLSHHILLGNLRNCGLDE